MSEQNRNIKYIACNLCGTFPDEAIAIRFRRVCKILDLQRFVPDDDMELYRCMFSVLGIMARTLEKQKAATVEANKRNEALDGQVAELKVQIEGLIESGSAAMTSLKDSNNDLREALEEIARDSFVDSWQNKLAQKALSATPAESLAKHDNEVIKRWLCKIYPKSEG